MSCACIADVNNKLAEHNGQLVTTLLSDPERVVLEVIKLDNRKRGRVPQMLASFCPFCGDRYAPQAAAAAAAAADR